MDIRELKKMLKNSTSVLILDDGEPAFVVLDYGVYKKVVLEKDKELQVKINQNGNPASALNPSQGARAGNGGPPAQVQQRESEVLERLNKEILALKEQIEIEERREFGPGQTSQE